MKYDSNCKDCDRLSSFLGQVKNKNPDYFCKPVPSVGQKETPFLIVGLAPGMHGANKTGRPFTGDHAGILLYKTLYKFGFSNSDKSESASDNLKLNRCRITNAVKCLPPDNKPSTAEIKNCNKFLRSEIFELKENSILLALGLIAHNAILRALNLTKKEYKFAHGRRHNLPKKLIMFDSYHCSRYNTQTKRLTESMFHEVFLSIKTEMEN
jgi:uracil-DNA glycosylase family 4|tara:strand:+ start:5504 stop:6133 length:630 start_codon:yes stop_codon:yes gene_type:complete